MAGDVVTAGAAETDVTQDLPAADDGVTSAAGMPVEPQADGEQQGGQGRTGGSGKKSQGRSGSARAARKAAQPADGTGPSQASPDGASGAAAVRRRLARLGSARVGSVNPVLEPLVKTVRMTHPKADIRLIERAYGVAARLHSGCGFH